MWLVAARLLAYSYAVPTLAHLVLHPMMERGEVIPLWLFYSISLLVGMSAAIQFLASLTPDVFPKTPLTRPSIAWLSIGIGLIAEGFGSSTMLDFILWYGLCQLVVLVMAACYGLSKLAKFE